MKQPMMYRKTVWQKALVRELAAALGVLALVFLSFAHQPVAGQASDGYFRLADGSVAVFCGSGPSGNDDSSTHAECDACRISSSVALPQVPCSAGERFALAVSSGVLLDDAVAYSSVLNDATRPRAPPFA